MSGPSSGGQDEDPPNARRKGAEILSSSPDELSASPVGESAGVRRCPAVKWALKFVYRVRKMMIHVVSRLAQDKMTRSTKS